MALSVPLNETKVSDLFVKLISHNLFPDIIPGPILSFHDETHLKGSSDTRGKSICRYHYMDWSFYHVQMGYLNRLIHSTNTFRQTCLTWVLNCHAGWKCGSLKSVKGQRFKIKRPIFTPLTFLQDIIHGYDVDHDNTAHLWHIVAVRKGSWLDHWEWDPREEMQLLYLTCCLHTGPWISNPH